MLTSPGSTLYVTMYPCSTGACCNALRSWLGVYGNVLFAVKDTSETEGSARISLSRLSRLFDEEQLWVRAESLTGVGWVKVSDRQRVDHCVPVSP